MHKCAYVRIMKREWVRIIIPTGHCSLTLKSVSSLAILPTSKAGYSGIQLPERRLLVTLLSLMKEPFLVHLESLLT